MYVLRYIGGRLGRLARRRRRRLRASGLLNNYIIRKTDSIHHHHPEGVVYRGFCLNSGTVAVSKFPFRWWWCIESVFPIMNKCTYMNKSLYE